MVSIGQPKRSFMSLWATKYYFELLSIKLKSAVRNPSPQCKKICPCLVLQLIGYCHFISQVDLASDRQVSREMGASVAAAYDIEFFETSAFSGSNIHEMYTRVASLIHNKQVLLLRVAAEEEAKRSRHRRTDSSRGGGWEIINLNNTQNADCGLQDRGQTLNKKKPCCTS